MRAVSSWTRLYTDLSSRIRRAILDVAWMTVVWSRPPNSLPIFGRDESVSSRERYIATWRGYTMFWERLSPQSSSIDSWKRSETSSWIRRIETSAASPWGNTFLSTSSARTTESERPVREEKATTRVRAPSNSRMLVEMREAMNDSTWGS